MWFSKRGDSGERSKGKRIYLDYASATPLLKEASEAMRDAEKFFGNPGAIHHEGVETKRALESARERIALILGVKARELVFTSGLTESNNLAIVGFARAILVSGFLPIPRSDLGNYQGRTLAAPLAGTHWIVSAIEHASVLECFSEIERMGGEVSHVMPSEKGIITQEAIEKLLKKETVFVSVGWANNEIGVIQPLSKISESLRRHEMENGTTIIFHADAGQAPLYESTLVHSLGVDLLSLGASKLYGPHGIGALYLSNKVQLASVILGGDQERALRAGTENVALASGFAAAFETVAKERQTETKRLKLMRDTLARELTERIPGLVINGDLRQALPHMLNISIPARQTPSGASVGTSPLGGVEYLTLQLDREGFAVSTKSACDEGNKSSHVVEALERAKSALSSEVSAKEGRAENTLRISLGRATNEEDLKHCKDTLLKLLSHDIVR